ncbi:MAG: helix-turn-helix domain-containing protein [Elusimicrobia bacterium]|nr:helix-turn-helix domain-containing protein [Elusimicrobiota bacterium]
MNPEEPPLTLLGNEGRSPVIEAEPEGKVGRLLTVKEVAQILQFAPYTIRRWIRMGKLPAVRFSQKTIRVEAEFIDRLIRLNEE